jgi:hypothetical protein
MGKRVEELKGKNARMHDLTADRRRLTAKKSETESRRNGETEKKRIKKEEPRNKIKE